MPDTTDAPADQFHERAEESRTKLWLLLTADRWLVTGLLIVLTFGVLVCAGSLYPDADAALRGGDSVDTAFQGLLTATITGVTLVVTLNQLVLSQELGPAGDQRERMEKTMAFRSEVADAIQAPVSPSRPSQFLRGLVELSAARAKTLRDGVQEPADQERQAAVEGLTDSLIQNASQVSEKLDGARFGEFDVVSAALDFNYSWKLFACRRIREEYGSTLDEQSTAALDDLIELLTLFGPAREHFKTLYFQRALIDLSRRILFASFPALLISVGMILFFNAETYRLVVFQTSTLVVVVSAAVTVALIPFYILLAHVMRIAVIANHTLSIGPFILRDTEQATEVDWDQ